MLNTIGPVWDGNEVWLITAGGAMFAAFPHWYATVFSTLYLPLLVILLAMIARIVAIEWRGKIDDPKWRRWCDIGIAVGSWLPAILWGVAFAILVRGLPIGPDKNVVGLSVTDVLNPYTLLGGLATCALFLFHGAVFLALKTGGAVRDDAVGLAASAQRTRDRAGRRVRCVDPTGARQGLDVGGAWRWPWSRNWPRSRLAWRRPRRLGLPLHHDRRRRGGDPALRIAVPESGAVDARPGLQPDDPQRLVQPLHPEGDDVGRS